MKKHHKGQKFSLKAAPRNALSNGLAQALLFKEKIHTTLAQAKEAARVAEAVVTRAKMSGLFAHREIGAMLGEKLHKKIFNELAKRYEHRQGGYTRITKLGPRKSDSAKMAIVEMIK